MNDVYKNFYKKFYLNTAGFIPSAPGNENMFPGDFFQIRNGEKIILGNIFRNNIIDSNNCKFGYGIKLNPASWTFSDGVTKPQAGGSSKFLHRGSFSFKALEPESVKILNWDDLKDELIIKLTQTIYSFRELYVVTESVSATEWALAIAGGEGAELEITDDAVKPNNIEYYYRETKRKPTFFKARKLAVQDDKRNNFISELTAQKENKNEWVKNFFDYDFNYDDVILPVTTNAQASVLDMLQANELNPNTALLYFKWVDADLNDIERLF